MLLGANQTQGLLPVYCVVYIDPIAKTSIYILFFGAITDWINFVLKLW